MSVASVRSANDGSTRNARRVKCGKLASELSARSGRSRRLARGGVVRRGRRLCARRCTGAR